MSTYTDLHNKIRENIAVDYSSRTTPQLVKFTNLSNEFSGIMSNGIISGTALNGCILPDGKKLENELSNIYDLISELSSHLTALTSLTASN